MANPDARFGSPGGAGPPPRGGSERPPALPVFIKRGDARAEVDGIMTRLGSTPDHLGFRKYMYVAKADQTVVMVADRQSPLAGVLRAEPGWTEPVEP